MKHGELAAVHTVAEVGFKLRRSAAGDVELEVEEQNISMKTVDLDVLTSVESTVVLAPGKVEAEMGIQK